MASMPNLSAGQTPRFSKKREMILDAAARLFHTHGLDGVTLADIGARVGLATNSVTYYYRRRDDLIHACFDKAFRVFHELIDDAAAHTGVEGRVRAFLRAYYQLLADIEDGKRSDIVNFNNLAMVRGPAASAIADAYTGMFRSIRQLVHAGDEACAGRARVNSETHLLLALSQWGRVWLQRYQTSDYLRMADHVAGILCHGLATGDGNHQAQPQPCRHRSNADKLFGRTPEQFLSRELFLRAATRLINAHGVHGASVERISASVNVTKGAFYHHISDKRELISACFERTFSVIRAAQDAAAQEPDGRTRLENAAASLVRFQLSETGPLLRITARTGLPAGDAPGVLSTMNQLSERFAGFVIDGMIDGSIRVVDPTAASQMMQAMINAAASAPRWAPGISERDAVNFLLGPLLHGLRGSGNAPTRVE